MSDWSDRVLAAEAIKAGSVSEDTRLIPSSPSRTDTIIIIITAEVTIVTVLKDFKVIK